MIKIHPHAIERCEERGATENEINITVESGEIFPAKIERRDQSGNKTQDHRS